MKVTYLFAPVLSSPVVIQILPDFPHFTWGLGGFPFPGQLVPLVTWHIADELGLVVGLSQEILLLNYDLLEIWLQEFVSFFQSWVQWRGESQFARIFVTGADVKVLCYRGSHFVVHVSGLWVTDPAMDTSSS